MQPFTNLLHLGSGRSGSAVYVGGVQTTKMAGVSFVDLKGSLPAGTEVGDTYVAIMATTTTSDTLTGPGQTAQVTQNLSVGGLKASAFVGRISTLAVFAFSGTMQECAIAFAIYRGPTSHAIMGSGSGSGTSRTVSYSKTSSGISAVGLHLYEGAAVTLTEPSGWASRLSRSLGNYGDEISDLLDLTGYSGSSVTFGLSAARETAACVVELRA